MIDKMSAFYGRAIGPGQSDPVRPADRSDAMQSAGTDKARSSTESGGLASAIDHMVQQGMPVDSARIQVIRQAIADGQYPVDPIKIAENMIDFDRSGGDFS